MPTRVWWEETHTHAHTYIQKTQNKTKTRRAGLKGVTLRNFTGRERRGEGGKGKGEGRRGGPTQPETQASIMASTWPILPHATQVRYERTSQTAATLPITHKHPAILGKGGIPDLSEDDDDDDDDGDDAYEDALLLLFSSFPTRNGTLHQPPLLCEFEPAPKSSWNSGPPPSCH